MLQWWSRCEQKNVAERVDGDFIAAIARAREIDEQLEIVKPGGQERRRLRHADVVSAFKADLERRANAGEIDPSTVDRYGSALQHYLDFVSSPKVESRYRFVVSIDRDFALEFSAHLSRVCVSPNGHPHTAPRPLKGTRYIEDVVRAMYAWAADPHRGSLLPTSFSSPFSGRNRRSIQESIDPFSEPAITVEMAVEFLRSCDLFQLPPFALLALYGLRAAEPTFLFREHIVDGYLYVGCDPDLGYLTKGRRNKRLPLLPCVEGVLEPARGPSGLLFVRRDVAGGRETPRLVEASLEKLRGEFSARCRGGEDASAREYRRIRTAVLQEAGALTYDHVQHEFLRISRRLGWQRSATIKGFRHLFSTCMQNAGMPEMYGRYLMGHSLGRSAIVAYSHLNEVRQHYQRAVARTMQPVVDAVIARSNELGFGNDENRAEGAK